MKPLETTAIVLIGLVIGLSDCGDVASDTSNGQEHKHNLTYNEKEMLEHALHEIEKRLKESPESLEYRNISHFTQLSPDPSYRGRQMHFCVWASFSRKLYYGKHCFEDEGDECPTEPIANSRHEIEVQMASDCSGPLVRFIPIDDDGDLLNKPSTDESHPNDREYSILNQVLPEISTRFGEDNVVYRNISHFSQITQNRNVKGQRFFISADFERKISILYTAGIYENKKLGTEVNYEPIDNSQHEIEVQQYSNGSVALLKFIRSNDDSFYDHSTIDSNYHPTDDHTNHPNKEELSELLKHLIDIITKIVVLFRN